MPLGQCDTDPMPEKSNRVELKFRLSGPDLERLVVVGGDLDYLASLPKDRLFSHSEIRLAASVLRRLFVDDLIGAVWRSIGGSRVGPLTLLATDIDSSLNEWPEGSIAYAWAGGALVTTVGHAGFLLAKVPAKDGKPQEPTLSSMANQAEHRFVSMSIHRWLRSTSVAMNTNTDGLVRISRQSVLTYMANRKGGVHFDPRRGIDLPKKGPKKHRDIESRLLDHGLLRIGHLSGPEFEVMSMVHAVVSCDWALELSRAAVDLAPEDFQGDPQIVKFWTGMREADGSGWATVRTTSDPPDREPQVATEGGGGS